MANSRIYHPFAMKAQEEQVLEPQASQHIIKVLRMRVGEALILFNGNKPGEYKATLIGVQKRLAKVRIDEYREVHNESPLHIHLLQGLSKGERMDYALQKAVELGVNQITPVISARCNVKLPAERIEKRLTHWQQVVISACEQSGRCFVPTVMPPTLFSQCLVNTDGEKIIADPTAPHSMSARQSNQVALFIGPEGGFSDEEVALAKEHAAKAIKLGPRILRTETACVVGITLLQAMAGDL